MADLHQICMIVPGYKRKPSSSRKLWQWDMIWWRYKNGSFCWKISNFYTLLKLPGTQLRRASWVIRTFVNEMLDTFFNVNWGPKFLNDFLVQARGSSSQGRDKNVLFCTSFTLLGHSHFQSPLRLTWMQITMSCV